MICGLNLSDISIIGHRYSWFWMYSWVQSSVWRRWYHLLQWVHATLGEQVSQLKIYAIQIQHFDKAEAADVRNLKLGPDVSFEPLTNLPRFSNQPCFHFEHKISLTKKQKTFFFFFNTVNILDSSSLCVPLLTHIFSV